MYANRRFTHTQRREREEENGTQRWAKNRDIAAVARIAGMKQTILCSGTN